MRALGESLERYVHFAYSAWAGNDRLRLSRLGDFPCGSAVRPLSLFRKEQFGRSGFPFREFDEQALYGWVPATEAQSGEEFLVPAQMAVVGYLANSGVGEPRFVAGVTTGTAVHPNADTAALSAVLELIQVDLVMGHWYGAIDALEVKVDHRVRALASVLERSWGRALPYPRFFLIPSPDSFPTFTIVCLVESPGRAPEVTFGQSCSTCLESAMYRSLLEAIGVRGLARINLLEAGLAGETGGGGEGVVYNLDDNVTEFAVGKHRHLVDAKFRQGVAIRAADLPPDAGGAPGDCVRKIIRHAGEVCGIRLFEFDLECAETRRLGLAVARYVSPDLLPLSLPGAPYLGHPRYEGVYGGVVHAEAHPYP